MAKYQNQVPDTARVTFDVNPQGAELYVNGSLTDPSKPVSLKYGNHSVKVSLEGYEDYSGIITVKDARQKKVRMSRPTVPILPARFPMIRPPLRVRAVSLMITTIRLR